MEYEAALLCVTMREQTMALVDTIQCIRFWCNFCDYKVQFCGSLFKGILAWERGISKRQFLERNCSSQCNLSFPIQPIQGCEYMFSVMSLSKSFVQHSYRFRVIREHSCHRRVARVALAQPMLHSCRACVWLSCCEMDQIILWKP